MENKFIPSIETEIRKLKSLLVSFIIVCLLMGAVALIRGESLERSLFFSGYIFLIALFLFCLWVIYTVIRATISRTRRRTIIKKGGRVEGVVRKVIWERSYRGVKKGVRLNRNADVYFTSGGAAFVWRKISRKNWFVEDG